MIFKKPFISTLAVLCLLIFNPGFATAQDEETAPPSGTEIQSADIPAGEEPAPPVPEENAATKTAEEQPAVAPENTVQTTAASSSAGGGAAGGIGTPNGSYLAAPTPDNSEFTGSANYKIPILSPPGRNGLAPSIALTYNSMRGNSWVAVGWDLDLGAIRRSTKRGVIYSNNDFVFSSEGKSYDLVDRSSSWGANFFGAKAEEDFTKYNFVHNPLDPNPDPNVKSWIATAKDGTKYFYGSTADSRQSRDNLDVNIFQWCLDRIEDTNGNYITITYTKDQNQLYPFEIKYTGHVNPNLEPTNTIRFILEVADRTDSTMSYLIMSKVVTAKRLKTIEVYAGTQFVRKYVIENSYSPITKRTLLKSVTEYGSDNISTLPPVKFTYQEGPALGVFEFQSSQTISWPCIGPPVPGQIGNRNLGSFSAFDTNGDSLADLYFSGYYEKPPAVCGESGNGGGVHCTDPPDLNCPAYFETGQGNGNFTNHSELGLIRAADGCERDPYDPTKVNCNLIASSRSTIGDLNGDGNQEVITVSQGSHGYPASCPWCNPKNMKINGQEYDLPYYDQPVSTCDLNGDGYADLFFERDHKVKAKDCGDANCGNQEEYEYWPEPFFLIGNGDGTFKPNMIGLGGMPCCEPNVAAGAILVGCSDSWDNQYWNKEKCNRTFGDFNGDGRTDMLFASAFSSSVKTVVFFGKGDGGFAKGPTGVYGLSYEPVSTMDLNNDGLSDLVVSSHVFLSNGNGTFDSNAISIGYMQPWPTFPTIFGDFNGDGRLDCVAIWNGNERRFYIGTPGLFPDLLSKVENSMGGSALIAYQPSTAFVNKNLPYAMQVVKSVTTDDGLGLGHVYTTNYTYSGGLYDHIEREFYGFEKAIKTNPNGTQETTWFNQDYYLKGKPSKIEFNAPADQGGALLSQTTLTWDTVPLSSGVTFVKLSQKKTESYDAETVLSQENYTYDEDEPVANQAGNLKKVETSGTEAENVTKANQYQNYGTWVWRTTQETLTDSANVLLRKTDYQYKTGTGNLWTKTAWCKYMEAVETSPVIRYEYDTYGNVSDEFDPKGNQSNQSTHVDYETTHTYPEFVTNPKGHIVKYVVDYRYGYAAQKIDVSNNNNTITYSYDAFGRLTKTQNPDGGETKVTYYDMAFPRYTKTEVKEAVNSYIPTYGYYDGFGRSIQVSTLGNTLVDNIPTPISIISQTYYDYMGRVDLTNGPFFGSGMGYPQTAPATGYPLVWTSYDFRGRPVTVKSKHGDYPGIDEYITTSYAYQGFKTTVTDPDGSTKREVKDYLGRIIRVREWIMDNGVMTTTLTSYVYNAAGDLLKVTDAQGNITTLTYDTLGRKRDMVDPDMGHWKYEYDLNGNLIKQTDAKSQVIKFEYDPLNRVLNKKYYDINDQPLPNNSSVFYIYDNATPSSANGIGKPYTVTKGNVVLTNNKYDSMGRSLKVTKRIDTTDYITQNEYDLSGKVKKLIYPDNYFITYAYYPGTNLIESIADSNNIVQAVYTDYEPTGKIGQIDYHNGTATKYNYDAWSTKLFGIVTEDPTRDPLKQLQNREYTYSRAGDIIQIKDNAQKVTYDYTYDMLHRLIAEKLSGTNAPIVTKVETITLDYTGTGPVHGVKTITLNGVSRTCAYDLNGNMITSPDFTTATNPLNRAITYDADNMPVEIVHANGATVDFVYDGTAKRTKKLVQSGKTVLYLGDHFEVENGVNIKYIFGGNLRLSQIKGSLTSYFHKDHLGSTSAVTNEAGVKVESTTYEPFGSTRVHDGSEVSAYKFTDQELDNETNLYNYDARIYDPVLGMFVTPDSIVQDFFDPQFFNRFSYVRNNPLIYTDPTGHRTPIEGTPGQSDEFSVHESPNYPGGCIVTEGGDRFTNPEERNLANYILTENTGFLDKLQGDLGYYPGFEQFVQDVMAGLFGGPYSNLGAALVAGKVLTTEVPGIPPSQGTSPNLNRNQVPQNEEVQIPKITERYKRPNNATTKKQRESVQNKPCATCGQTGGKKIADHKTPLVKEHYETGTIDKAKMVQVESVQPQCSTCSAKQAAEMRAYSMSMREKYGL